MTTVAPISIQEKLAKGLQLERLNKPSEALEYYQGLRENGLNNEQLLFRISSLYMRLKDYPNAVKTFHSILEIGTNKHVAYFNLAIIYRNQRAIDEAIDYLKLCIKFAPKYVLALPPLFQLLHKKKRLEEFEELLADIKHEIHKVGEYSWMQAKLLMCNKDSKQACEHMHIALQHGICKQLKSGFYSDFAFMLEQSKQYDEAMDYHQKAQSLFSVSMDAKQVDQTFSKTFIQQSFAEISQSDENSWQNQSSQRVSQKNTPIFLMGFARSGTTLLEQMFFAHKDSVVTDELQVFQHCIASLNQILGKEISYPSSFKDLNSKEIELVRTRYFSEMRMRLPNYRKDKRIVDKNPFLISYLACIKRFFADASIIMMIRDPRDVCLSCFFQNFSPNNATVNFYGLEQTFRYYAQLMRLYLFFRKTLNLNLIEVKYESLCQAPEDTLKPILEFVDMNWDASLLDYFKLDKARYIQTPSFEAVNQSVNTSAIGKWKNYIKHIEPYEHIVEPYLKAFGYLTIDELRQRGEL